MHWFKITLALLAAGALPGMTLGEDSIDGDKIDSTYKKVRVENRAKFFAEREAGGADVYEKYVYVGDEELRKMAKEQAGSNNISVASPTIGKDSKIRKVNVVVDAKRDVTFQSKRSYVIDSKESTKADIAVTKLEKGSRVREVNTLVDTKNLAIDSDSRTVKRGVRVTPKGSKPDQEGSDE